MEYEYELRRLQIDAYLAMPWKHKLAVLQLKLKNYDKLRSWDIIDDYEQHFLIALIKICRRKSIPFLDSDGSYPELEKELDNFHAKYMNGVKNFDSDIWREVRPQFGEKLFGLWVLI